MPKQLYTIDADGELWLDNPALIIGNPRRSTKAMAKRYSRKRKAHGRRRARRNGGLILNRPRRRARRRRYSAAMRRLTGKRYGYNKPRRRRHYRRNPPTMKVAGVALPPFDAILYTGAGFIVPPIVQGFVMRFIPAQYQSNQGVMWAVKAASAIVPPMLVKRFVSARAGNLMLLGGVVSLAIDAVRTFAPGVIPGLGSQPFLGRYYNRGGMGKYFNMPQRQALGAGPGGAPSAIFGGVPERLSPSARF